VPTIPSLVQHIAAEPLGCLPLIPALHRKQSNVEGREQSVADGCVVCSREMHGGGQKRGHQAVS
jgi:hypothetical protein